ncbi:hypothetical protein JOJ86_000389 [Rhodococcus percolatus]|uniref:Uncharacterized protein n=1 Tax=Rhodococcus opacus TaxID=37919 RepID=A0A1B1KFB2_RHOOP|nr:MULTISPECIES: hypothetical protein [Rhodococcus]ANS31292.1 hypothetical protein R1CP_33345 [Rhodococcus opacus]MBA8961473.1 hypothetical protein [Rhodococcus opacus]MBP2202663.1 hypothetical protein [Rhodococcus opacus]MCZ4587897.1 hypothetical protein [Rhodococcus opacus]QDQ95232.1 hypothetical protein FND50_33740 [Rhodococcus sp. WB9]
MTLNWDNVLEKYRDGAEIDSLPGAATLSVSGADEEKIYVKHRLWKDSLSRTNLERAIEMVSAGTMTRTAADFIDQYRTIIADERPTTAATVLKDLGYLD